MAASGPFDLETLPGIKCLAVDPGFSAGLIYRFSYEVKV
jgi:hypothetical protein